jgi:hypothetical protein
MLNNDFVNEMAKNTVKHGFRAKMMVDAFEQEETSDTLPVVNNLNVSKAASKGHNPCPTASKGFRDEWPSKSGPSINTSCVGKKHEVKQAKMIFFSS